jgi:ubiquinone biosynthesis monooxygenase Coq6
MKRLTNFFFLKNFNLNRQFSTIIKQNEQIFDIVIIGGGMVGSSLACALASTPITSKQKIALIDNQPFSFSNQQNYPDLRVSLLNHSSIKLLKAINCWKLLKETKRITPVSNMIVWDASGNGSIDFNIENKDIITSDNEDDDLMNTIGYMIENKNIQNSLFTILQSFSSVKIFSSSFIETIQISNNHFENNDWVNIELKDGVNLKTRLLVGADGYQSIVRKNCKFSTTGWSYNQIAIVASVEHSKNIHNLTAWQRFLPTGPLALLPMFENYSSIVWSTTLSDSHYLLSLSNDNFVKKLNESFIAPLSNLHFSFINNDFLKFFSTSK